MVRACQPLWPFGNDEVYQQFTYVTHPELAWHLTPHGGWQCRPVPVTEVSRQSRGTLSPKLHTQPLPVEHVWIGNCRSHNRSQFQAPYFGAWDTTRQERALLPSLLYVRHAMGSSTCRTISVSLDAYNRKAARKQKSLPSNFSKPSTQVLRRQVTLSQEQLAILHSADDALESAP